MIWNIVDNRKRKYRWRCVNAVIEPTWQDNSCQDCDQVEASDSMDVSVYEESAGISLADAIAWANERSYPVTLYVYDEGGGVQRASLNFS